MNTQKVLLTTILLVSAYTNCLAALDVTVERSEQGAVVRIDGELFAEYRTHPIHQPAIWPIIGPSGKPMTRSYPVGPLLETELEDHPHHHSLWVTHQDVNGHDFWAPRDEEKPKNERKIIKHLEFSKIAIEDNEAVIVTRNRWLAGVDHPMCEDERTWVFGADEESRWIDCTIKIIASHGEVTFGDIKDGFFSLRVAGTMKVDAELGGQVVNSRGQTGKGAWAMPAEWVDYYGPVEGETVGAAIFSHPANFQHPCRWHVRSYGLFTANPFGEKEFPPCEIVQDGRTIAAGESLTLRYRALFHLGDTEQGKVSEAYEKYVDAGPAGRLPVVLDEDFQHRMDRWTTTDRGQTLRMWSLESGGGYGNENRVLRVSGESTYEPPHRSPRSIALLKDVVVEDFELTADVQSTNSEGGDHRDLCFFWGYQDPAHFYYVHLGAKPDPHSCQIFLVDDADRKKITEKASEGTPWTGDWHKVKVRHDVESGLMEVFFDDMQTPVMTARDKTFSWGRIGVGTFDDHGNFDNLKLRGHVVQPIPVEAKLP